MLCYFSLVLRWQDRFTGGRGYLPSPNVAEE